MKRSTVLAAVVATALLPLSAFAHGGGGGGHSGGGGGGHSGGGGGHGGGGGGGHSFGGHSAGGHSAAAHAAAANSSGRLSAAGLGLAGASSTGRGGGYASAHAGQAHPYHHAGKPGSWSHEGKLGAGASGLAAASHPSTKPVQQTNPFAKEHPRRHEVNQREREQMAQIMQGVKSGKLSPAQAKQLLTNDRAIGQQERADLRANGGHLTKGEQRQLNGEENANRALLHADEHRIPAGAAVPTAKAAPVSNAAPSSAAVPAVASRPGNPIGAPGSRFAEHHPRRDEVNRRERDQRAQIAEGLKSGKLTPAQAKQLLANDKSIKQQEHADVKANGGYLTKSEQRQFNGEENANRALLHADEHPAP